MIISIGQNNQPTPTATSDCVTTAAVVAAIASADAASAGDTAAAGMAPIDALQLYLQNLLSPTNIYILTTCLTLFVSLIDVNLAYSYIAFSL